MSTKYTMKFYKGRKLIAEQTWDLNEAFLDDVTHDAENLIEEALECNPPEPQKADHGGTSERFQRIVNARNDARRAIGATA